MNQTIGLYLNFKKFGNELRIYNGELPICKYLK